MAFDAWSSIGTIGGAGALSYLAAGQKVDDKHTLRLSLDKQGSLLGDVRLIGGVLTALATMWVKNAQAKKVLGTTAVASFASLLSTEVVRYRLAKSGTGVAKKLPLAPSTTFGALPGSSGAAGRKAAYAQNQAWAQR